MNVIVAEKCDVKVTLEYMEEFAREKMCRRCVPCVMATEQAIDLLYKFTLGEGTSEMLQLLHSIAEGMEEAVMCKHGREAGNYLKEAVSKHKDQFEQHISGSCPKKFCPALIEFKIIPEKCTLCGVCKMICKEEAIVGEKRESFVADYKPFYIRDEKCTRCGLCLPACETKAIEVSEREAK